MAQAKTARGRFMGALGAEDGPLIFLPSLTLVPPGFTAGRDISGGGSTEEKDVFTAYFPASGLTGDIEKYVYSALARGGGDALIGKFLFYVVCRDIGSNDKTKLFTVRYEGASLVPKGKRCFMLRPGIRGVAGYVPVSSVGDGGDIDETFEAES